MQGNVLTKTLLPKRHSLQFIQAVLLGSAVYNSVLEDITIYAEMVDGRFNRSTAIVTQLLDLPRVSPLIVYQAWVVVAFVEVFEDRRKDLRFLVGQADFLVG